MCLGGFAPWSMAFTMNSHDRTPSNGEGKHQLPSKPALVKNNSCLLSKPIKKVAFVPTLQEIHDSLSRKMSRASLSCLSDRATMGTGDLDYETASSCLENISILAEAGGSRCGSSINDVSPIRSVKRLTTSHVRNVSSTAVFGDETSTSTEKEPHLWASHKSGSHTASGLSYHARSLDLSATTQNSYFRHTSASNISMTHGSDPIDAPDRPSPADRVSDSEAVVDRLAWPFSHHNSYVQGYVNEPMPAGPNTRSTGCNDAHPLVPRPADASAQAIGPDRCAKQHECSIGVLSAFEEKFLSYEDKQAILEGGCHGLCVLQTTFVDDNSSTNRPSRVRSIKLSPPAGAPSDRSARFISSMPSDIMPNGRRGENSTPPRFSHRRVAAEYKRPRSPLACVEHPSRKPARHSGISLAQLCPLEQTDCLSPGNTVWDSNNEPIDASSLPRNQGLFNAWCRPKQQLKRQSKHDDLRQECESQNQLAEEVVETVEAKEDGEAVQGKEKGFVVREFSRRLRALWFPEFSRHLRALF
ncbi:hypothetical protein KCU95_g6409, partial [Aureobasidium melanogenum]